MRDMIIVHCSATPPSLDIGVEVIDNWHKAKGWDGIGYHYVIRRNGTVEPGRDISKTGAHAKGYNSRSIGICLVGGINEDNTPDANFSIGQYNRLKEIIDGLILSKVVTKDVKIVGHRDLDGVTKACPCFDVSNLGL